MDTRSGEALSAMVAAVITLCAMFQNEAPLYNVIRLSEMPFVWGALMMSSSLFTLASVCVANSDVTSLARYFSGVLWFALLTIFAQQGAIHYATFWVAVVMLVFDIVVVVVKDQSWARSTEKS